ncbi:cobalamin (vitamin B12) biosynthesis CbiM protein [Thermovirga lienii DSM 17291]|jgi:cobalt/nickel transport system permease protein|uniref:Cobalamin (Vitamin B12) biosynthesis CbiM protein n=1 Tax=Thermovirga lienii (strain ATCC BAA-1197 / DSM 17291 / Cas60314) TaxID=580340 RepID=G7V832_THELD|nr:cobalt transporter CbiM [Thermovirga lienii]AER67363.1 cobalamin (vitamin B12) biosynthesis CbiM protein [Thermovirga lienii DSM 17291]MDN5319538.1 cobalt/nickel transport system permease protein [Thermovirga sp.]MDN5368636.1 cobalt/nickel transport system permease protein [Thermovirga sp.]HCD72487.1 cobalt transporter CbiM [Thermovirga lienii]
MHIAEGVLSWPVLVSGAAIATAGTAYGIKKLSFETIPRCGIVSAALFVASLIHVNLGASSVHLILGGLGGILLGWSLFPAFLVALFLQAVLFQFGGLVVLGVNVTNMALSGVLAGFVGRALLKRLKRPFLCGAISGALGVFGAAVFVAASLAFSGEAFRASAVLLIGAHLPVAIIEGIITGFIVSFLSKTDKNFLEV